MLLTTTTTNMQFILNRLSRILNKKTKTSPHYNGAFCKVPQRKKFKFVSLTLMVFSRPFVTIFSAVSERLLLLLHFFFSPFQEVNSQFHLRAMRNYCSVLHGFISSQAIFIYLFVYFPDYVVVFGFCVMLFYSKILCHR